MVSLAEVVMALEAEAMAEDQVAMLVAVAAVVKATAVEGGRVTEAMVEEGKVMAEAAVVVEEDKVMVVVEVEGGRVIVVDGESHHQIILQHCQH